MVAINNSILCSTGEGYSSQLRRNDLHCCPNDNRTRYHAPPPIIGLAHSIHSNHKETKLKLKSKPKYCKRSSACKDHWPPPGICVHAPLIKTPPKCCQTSKRHRICHDSGIYRSIEMDETVVGDRAMIIVQRNKEIRQIVSGSYNIKYAQVHFPAPVPLLLPPTVRVSRSYHNELVYSLHECLGVSGVMQEPEGGSLLQNVLFSVE